MTTDAVNALSRLPVIVSTVYDTDFTDSKH